jgi:outer membrane protein OmpA-like peptidoglycan-associated protein
MRRFQARIAIIGLLVLGASCCALAQQQDVEGGKDHPLISRYPGSVIAEYVAREFDEYSLPLGKITDNKWAKSQHLEGKVTRIHYESPLNRSPLEIFRNYTQALQNAGFQTLFTCSNGDQCGGGTVETTGWCAGCSPYQISAKLSRPDVDIYVSLHLEQDNPGVPAQVQLDVIEMKAMQSGMVSVNAEALAGDITRTGHASIYGIYFDTGKADIKPESDATLKEIAKLLQQDAQLKLYVVGHTDNVGTLMANTDLSQRRADAVLNALTTKYGAAAARLHAVGAGPIAPAATNDTEEGRAKNRRVELVKQ